MVALVSPLSSDGSASRRRERRLRSFWRHEQLSLKMMAASMSHHNWQHRALVGVQTDEAVNEHVTLAAAPYAATASPFPGTEYATTCTFCLLRNDQLLWWNTCPHLWLSTSLPNFYLCCRGFTDRRSISFLGRFLPHPMYNQVHQGQTVATVQPHVTLQEPPQVPVGEWIQEQIVETIEVLPQERVDQHTAKQIVHVPIHQIQEQSTDLVTPQFRTSAVKASQVVGSFLSRKSLPHPPKWRPSIRAPRRPSAMMWRKCLTASKTSIRRLEGLRCSPSRWRSLHWRRLQWSFFQWWSPDRASAKRRRRTRYTPLPGIMENAVCLAPSAWPPTRRAWLCRRCTRWQFGRGLGIFLPFLGFLWMTRFLRICLPRLILRSLSACRREKPPFLRLRARHVHSDPDGFVLVRLGTPR